jgi:hypothetical protein
MIEKWILIIVVGLLLVLAISMYLDNKRLGEDNGYPKGRHDNYPSKKD